jgi:hypothetical protein
MPQARIVVPSIASGVQEPRESVPSRPSRSGLWDRIGFLPLSLRMFLGHCWIDSGTVARMFRSELCSLSHRIRSQSRKRVYLTLRPYLESARYLVPPDTLKTLRSDYITRLKAQKPWASLSDLSLCLEGWEAAIESILRTCHSEPHDIQCHKSLASESSKNQHDRLVWKHPKT